MSVAIDHDALSANLASLCARLEALERGSNEFKPVVEPIDAASLIEALALYAESNAKLADSVALLAAGVNELADAIAAPVEDVEEAPQVERDMSGRPVR